MTKEILKLRKVLDGFQKERCQIDLTREIFNSIMCTVSVQIYNIDGSFIHFSDIFFQENNNEDGADKQLIDQLNNQYSQLKDEFE